MALKRSFNKKIVGFDSNNAKIYKRKSGRKPRKPRVTRKQNFKVVGDFSLEIGIYNNK